MPVSLGALASPGWLGLGEGELDSRTKLSSRQHPHFAAALGQDHGVRAVGLAMCRLPKNYHSEELMKRPTVKQDSKNGQWLSRE